MESLKKVISLNQASKISGYHQDYLSSLIRKEEIKGKKVGGSWFTTEEEIKNYIFKQKIHHKKWAIRDFLSSKRINNIFIYTFIFLTLFFIALHFYDKKNDNPTEAVNTKLSDTNELGVIPVVEQSSLRDK